MCATEPYRRHTLFKHLRSVLPQRTSASHSGTTASRARSNSMYLLSLRVKSTTNRFTSSHVRSVYQSFRFRCACAMPRQKVSHTRTLHCACSVSTPWAALEFSVSYVRAAVWKWRRLKLAFCHSVSGLYEHRIPGNLVRPIFGGR